MEVLTMDFFLGMSQTLIWPWVVTTATKWSWALSRAAGPCSLIPVVSREPSATEKQWSVASEHVTEQNLVVATHPIIGLDRSTSHWTYHQRHCHRWIEFHCEKVIVEATASGRRPYFRFEHAAEFVNGHLLSDMKRLILNFIASSKRTLKWVKNFKSIQQCNNKINKI